MHRSFYSQVTGTLVLTGATLAPVVAFALIVEALRFAWA
jgi:hypothetical protein